MGCCPSKPPTLGKEYGATATEVAPILPSSVSANQVEPTVIENAVENMHMDRGDGTDGRATTQSRNSSGRTTTSVPTPRKPSQSADDIPISSTYHRVHCAEVAEQEAKWQEEQRLEAEQREREVCEYKQPCRLRETGQHCQRGQAALPRYLPPSYPTLTSLPSKKMTPVALALRGRRETQTTAEPASSVQRGVALRRDENLAPQVQLP
ncbi:hypothetical protein GQ600_7101 [Phytophthora cactorum]|nr:hypothetical protein GQ600_7101 [Phytophthora cactorum]